jgi:hypothetical protein
LLCLLRLWLVAVGEAVQKGEDVFRGNLIDGAITKLPDERLRTAADCLSRLRDLRPDPIPMPPGRHDLGNNFQTLYSKTGLVRA